MSIRACLRIQNYSFGSPVEMLIIPDHYVFRMLYSQGISLETLGIPAARVAIPAEYQLPESKTARDLANLCRSFLPVPRHTIRDLANQ